MQTQARSGPACCQRHAVFGLAVATRVQVRRGARTRDDQGPEKSWGIANKRRVVDQPASNQPPQQLLGIPAEATKGGVSCHSRKEPITKFKSCGALHLEQSGVWRIWRFPTKETARDLFWDRLTGTQAPTKTSPPNFQLLPAWSSAPSIIPHPSLTPSVSLSLRPFLILFSSSLPSS